MLHEENAYLDIFYIEKLTAPIDLALFFWFSTKQENANPFVHLQRSVLTKCFPKVCTTFKE